MTPNFFLRDTLSIAYDLIGKELSYQHPQHGTLSGIITETEAYTQEDPACHAYNGKKTNRTWPMFLEGGHIYIYMIYGMYRCLNISTEAEGRGCAVLIRSIEPLTGKDTMMKLRNKPVHHCTNGPGKLFQALDIDPSLNGKRIGGSLCIYDNKLPTGPVKRTPRIGISKGTDLLWRFVKK